MQIVIGLVVGMLIGSMGYYLGARNVFQCYYEAMLDVMSQGNHSSEDEATLSGIKIAVEKLAKELRIKL